MINDEVKAGESVVAVLKREGKPDRVIENPTVPPARDARDGDGDPFEIVLAIRDRRTGKLYKYEVKR